jgi:ParE toxin of type II toxin-antitoxin system, parDE
MRNDVVDLHDEAAAEYDAAFDWYLQRNPDAALKFDAEVERALTQIVQAPHPPKTATGLEFPTQAKTGLEWATRPRCLKFCFPDNEAAFTPHLFA